MVKCLNNKSQNNTVTLNIIYVYHDQTHYIDDTKKQTQIKPAMPSLSSPASRDFN